MQTSPPRAATTAGLPLPVLVAFVAIVAGFGATAGQVHPTGYPAWDVTLAGLATAAAVFIASAAPWWAPAAVAIATGLAVGRHHDWVLVGLAGGALVLALATIKLRHPVLTALSVGISAAVLCQLGRGPFMGASAVFGIGLIASLVIVGLVFQTKRVRRWSLAGWGLFALVMVLGGVGFGLAALQAKDVLQSGNDSARAGITALKAGDFSKASGLLQRASDEFALARHDLDRPWALLARVVPVVAQNRSTAIRLVGAAGDVAARAYGAASQIDPESLRVHLGAIDLKAVTALDPLVTELRDALVDLQDTLDAPMSGWVPRPLSDKLTGVRDDLATYRTGIDHLVLAVHTAPALLGADTPRTYFVAFSTPAETRSIGGFVGNYALLRFDKGRISLPGFGRSDDLRLAAPPGGMKLELPADFISRYGAFDFKNAAGLVDPLAWKNIGMSPDFPTMTSVVQQMYKATYGTSIDGMILMDPYPLAKLLDYTGPQTVAGYDTPITATNAVDFILRQQYLVLGHDDRVDLLDTLAHQTILQLLTGALPSPITLAKDLGPFTHDHRLMMWTDQPDEQAMFDAVGLSGRFPPATGTADFGITFNNAGPNKADAYLTHTVKVTERKDADLGDVVDVTLTLTNTMQPAGLPLYVTGNTDDLPLGTAYLYLSVYGPNDPVASTQDGESLAVQLDRELGVPVSSAYVEVPPDGSTTIVFTFDRADVPHAADSTVFVAPTAQRT
jgi:hypothetical protein